MSQRKYPFEECKESNGDCLECQYEGCEAWGTGYADEYADAEEVQSNNSNNMQSPETPCPTSDISLPDEVLPEVCEVGARGRDNSASKNQKATSEVNKP